MTHRLPVAIACLLALIACGNPKDAAGWARRAASRSRTDEKLEALGQVRKAPGDRRAAVPFLLEVLKQAPRARSEAALALGEIGDPAAVDTLAEVAHGLGDNLIARAAAVVIRRPPEAPPPC